MANIMKPWMSDKDNRICNDNHKSYQMRTIEPYRVFLFCHEPVVTRESQKASTSWGMTLEKMKGQITFSISF